MTMTVKQMTLAISRIDGQTKTSVQRGLYKAGKLLKSTANKDILSRDKTGKTYIIRRGPTRRRMRHIASAPGETLANRSGSARKTLDFVVRGTELEFGFSKNRKTSYVKYLEDKSGLNRPALGNAVKKRERQVATIIEREIQGVIAK